MIDFKRIECVNTKDAFVGIKKCCNQKDLENKENKNKYCFFLPKGMDVNLLKTNKNKEKILKELFFDLYKLQKKYNIKNPKKRDGTEIGKDGEGVSFNKDKPLFYFDIIDFLSVYNKTEVLGFNTRIVKNEDIDYSKIYQYLEDALYTKEGVPVILESFSPKNVISVSSNEIVKMYCFIYEDIKNELGEEVNFVVKKLSNEFKNKYLNSNKSIFESKSIIEQCKVLLEKFRKNTILLKDSKKYYDAIYKFLYFEVNNNDGLVMGIDNFYSIWEELCFDYFFNNDNLKDKIYCADYEKECNLNKNEIETIERKIFLSDRDIKEYPFKLVMSINEDNHTFIYPDLVLKDVFWYKVIFNSDFLCNVFCFMEMDINIENIIETNDFEDTKNDKEDKRKNIFQIGIEEKWFNFLKCFINKIKNEEGLFLNKNKREYFFYKKDKRFINITFKKDKQDYLNKEKRDNDFKFLKQNINIKFKEKIDRLIIDFKYESKDEITDEKDKVKQKIYELCLKEDKLKSKSIFVIPSWENDNDLLIIGENNDNILIRFYNLNYLLKEYLKDD